MQWQIKPQIHNNPNLENPILTDINSLETQIYDAEVKMSRQIINGWNLCGRLIKLTSVSCLGFSVN